MVENFPIADELVSSLTIPEQIFQSFDESNRLTAY
jgi:hypothetical protein